jgi:hypothetical protein
MKVNVSRVNAASTGTGKHFSVISTIYAVAEIQKIQPNHHRTMASTSTLDTAARPVPAQPAGSDIELTGVATHT